MHLACTYRQTELLRNIKTCLIEMNSEFTCLTTNWFTKLLGINGEAFVWLYLAFLTYNRIRINAMQVVQNKAARFSTGDWRKSIVEHLGSLCWLSVNQMIVYHTVLPMFKLRQSRSVGGLPASFYLLHIAQLNT